MKNWWQKLADFLHTANLIPLVVVVSTYHYYQALRSHDPFLVSLPIALFIDLLHFRTVQRAVQSGARGWQVTAAFTTLLAFGLQWIFYTQPGEGAALVWWQAILFASIVPVGLAIMAWHHQQQEQEMLTDWQALLAGAEAQVKDLQASAAAAQQRADVAQQEAAQERTRAAALQAQWSEVQAQASQAQQELERVQRDAQAAQAQVAAVQQEAEQAREHAAALQAQLIARQAEAEREQQQIAQLQAEASQMQSQVAELQSVQQAWQSLNLEMQTLALFNAQLLTAQDAAARLDVHVTTVRRKAKQLNGV